MSDGCAAPVDGASEDGCPKRCVTARRESDVGSASNAVSRARSSADLGEGAALTPQAQLSTQTDPRSTAILAAEATPEEVAARGKAQFEEEWADAQT